MVSIWCITILLCFCNAHLLLLTELIYFDPFRRLDPPFVLVLTKHCRAQEDGWQVALRGLYLSHFDCKLGPYWWQKQVEYGHLAYLWVNI